MIATSLIETSRITSLCTNMQAMLNCYIELFLAMLYMPVPSLFRSIAHAVISIYPFRFHTNCLNVGKHDFSQLPR